MPDLWMDVDAALAEVPVNVLPLIGDTDFKTIDETIAYNESGMDLVWNFVTTAGAMTQTAVTPTTSGDYDWAHQGNGMYSIEITASGGASINNDTEGFGWFTGVCDAVLPWRGPVIGFRAAGLNNLLTDSAYSATRGLAGTALPDAAADAAGGVPISDAGGLDIDAKLANTNEVTSARLSELDAGTAGKMANQVDEIRTDTGEIGTAGAGLSDLGGMSTGMKAEVNAEVLDTLVTDTHAEPGQGAPGATVSLKDKISYLYKFLRNKIVQNATTLEVYDDAGTTVDQKATVSDDGTDFTRGEIVSGP